MRRPSRSCASSSKRVPASSHGEFYDVDIPTLGPRVDLPPPIVASLGGPRTIREIAPLVDRVELKLVSTATKGGVLDVAALGSIPRRNVDELVAKVRDVNPTVPLGVMVICNVGADERTNAIEDLLGDSFMGGFFGPPEKVAGLTRRPRRGWHQSHPAEPVLGHVARPARSATVRSVKSVLTQPIG